MRVYVRMWDGCGEALAEARASLAARNQQLPEFHPADARHDKQMTQCTRTHVRMCPYMRVCGGVGWDGVGLG